MNTRRLPWEVTSHCVECRHRRVGWRVQALAGGINGDVFVAFGGMTGVVDAAVLVDHGGEFVSGSGRSSDEDAGRHVFMGMLLAASNWPVDTLITCTSATPVVGAFHGMTKLICAGRHNTAARRAVHRDLDIGQFRGQGHRVGPANASAVSLPKGMPTG